MWELVWYRLLKSNRRFESSLKEACRRNRSDQHERGLGAKVPVPWGMLSCGRRV